MYYITNHSMYIHMYSLNATVIYKSNGQFAKFILGSLDQINVKTINYAFKRC